MALHVIALMNGEQDAVQTALMEEYDWRPTGGYVRPALADRMIPNIDITTIEASLGKWKILSSTGDSRQWQVVAQGAAKADGKVVLQQVGALLESRAGWTRAVGSEPAATAGPSETARWTFADVEGKPWTGSLEVRPRAKSPREFEAILAIHHGE